MLRLYLIYGWGTWIRTKEMPDSESGALPLGYTPMSITYIILIGKHAFVNKNITFFSVFINLTEMRISLSFSAVLLKFAFYYYII